MKLAMGIRMGMWAGRSVRLIAPPGYLFVLPRALGMEALDHGGMFLFESVIGHCKNVYLHLHFHLLTNSRYTTAIENLSSLSITVTFRISSQTKLHCDGEYYLSVVSTMGQQLPQQAERQARRKPQIKAKIIKIEKTAENSRQTQNTTLNRARDRVDWLLWCKFSTKSRNYSIKKQTTRGVNRMHSQQRRKPNRGGTIMQSSGCLSPQIVIIT